MRIRLAVPNDLNKDEMEAVLNAAQEATTLAALPGLVRGSVPSFRQALAGKKVRWRPEPPGDEHFDLPRTVLGRGWGDCDDLAPWHAASLRASGEDPEARAIVRPSGPHRWHAVVQRHDGTIQDPSRAAGMGGVHGTDVSPFAAAWPSMFGDRLALATYPLRGGTWAARVDVPSSTMPMAVSALNAGVNPASAVVGSIRGALRLCEGIDPWLDDEVRLSGLHDLLCGSSVDEVEEAMAHVVGENVGFFGALAPAAMSLAAPVLKKVLPGGGGGGGGSAPAGGGGAGAPGSTLHCPGGPIIVRF